jgi:hypothetical protein
MAARSEFGRDHYAIDIDESREPFTKPPEVNPFVISVLIETDEKSLHKADAVGDERAVDKAAQTRSVQSRKFNLVGVIEI